MRVMLVTYGSEGDTRPFVGLALALRKAGHEVTLFAEQSAAYNADQHKVDVTILPGDIKSTLPIAQPHRELTRSDVLQAIKSGLRVVNDHALIWMESLRERATKADIILHAGLAIPASETIAAELDKPSMSLWLQPATPTRQFAAPTVPLFGLPGWMNRLSYKMGPYAMMHRFYGSAIERARIKLFGAAQRRPLSARKLYGFSSHLVPRPDDWPATDIVCGPWNQPIGEWRPDERLQTFLSQGDAPIYVGFGAVSSFIRKRRLDEIVGAIRGRRALFFPGWSEIDASMLPKNFLVIGPTPHSWLFPRTSLIVHHAGAGTAHTAALSGVPSVALPIGADQFFWARRLFDAGVAPKPVPGTKVGATQLAAMIQSASDASMRNRAKALAIKMKSEDGLVTAVHAIEALPGR